MPNKSESQIQSEIMLGLAGVCILHRTNAGSAWNGRIMNLNNKLQSLLGVRIPMIIAEPRKIKLLSEGHSDLTGFIIGSGRAVYIEVKQEGKKPKPEQANFLERMRGYGAIAGVAHSVEEARHIIEG